MKVIFKITVAQQMHAAAIAAALNQRIEEDLNHFNQGKRPGDGYRKVKCGDFSVIDTGYGVRRQDLTIEDGRLTYEGGRTTLKAGSLGALSIITAIFGSLENATQAVTACESTAHHLEWWETEEDGIKKASVERLVELSKCSKSIYVDFSAKEELKRRYGKLVLLPHVRLSAMLTKNELKELAVAKSALCTE